MSDNKPNDKDNDKNKKRKRTDKEDDKNEPPKKKPRRSRRLKDIKKDNSEEVSSDSSDTSDSPVIKPVNDKKKNKGIDTTDNNKEIEKSLDDIFSIILHRPFGKPRKPFSWDNRQHDEEKDYYEIVDEIDEEEDIDLLEVEKPEEFVEDIDMGKLKTLEGLMEIAEKYKNLNNKDMKVLVTLLDEMKELNKMIGMKEIKDVVTSQIVFLIQKFSRDDMMHTVIQGPPGCGKTTLAKILAKIYLKLGYTKNKKFIVAKRSDLIAGYLGQTAINTQRMINKAKGGVLFIDEIYSLGPGKHSNGDSFSKECIDTINQNLSENRNFVCIVAGYKEDIKDCFFSRNKGLERRFPWVYNIEKINYEQIEKIFISMIRKNDWGISEKEIPLDFFKNNFKYFPHNGGSVETFFAKVKMVHSKRVFGKSKVEKMNITKEDIKNALEIHRKFENLDEKINNKLPPPGMYV